MLMFLFWSFYLNFPQCIDLDSFAFQKYSGLLKWWGVGVAINFSIQLLSNLSVDNYLNRTGNYTPVTFVCLFIRTQLSWLERKKSQCHKKVREENWDPNISKPFPLFLWTQRVHPSLPFLLYPLLQPAHLLLNSFVSWETDFCPTFSSTHYSSPASIPSPSDIFPEIFLLVRNQSSTKEIINWRVYYTQGWLQSSESSTKQHH